MTKEEIYKQFNYEFSYWLKKFQSAPVELVRSENHSESYEMTAAHIFKLENGKFAFVTESGCSCYCADQAEIEILPTKKAAIEQFEKWLKSIANY